MLLKFENFEKQVKKCTLITGDIFLQQTFCFFYTYFLTPQILLFDTKNFVFLHQFVYTKTLLFYTKNFAFLHQFVYTSKFVFFTPKTLPFYTDFLHQNFAFLDHFFTSKFEIQKTIF